MSAGAAAGRCRRSRRLWRKPATVRLRAIMLTQITTVLGLLPLALGLGGREMLMTPMAIAIVQT